MAVAVAVFTMTPAPLQQPEQEAESHPGLASVPASATEAVNLDKEAQAEYDPSSVIASFDQGATTDAVNASLASVTSISEQQVTPDDINAGFAKFTIAEGGTVESAISQLGAVSGIASSQPNYRYHLLDSNTAPTSNAGSLSTGIITTLATEINDARHAEQWYLDATHGVDAYNAWDIAKSEGSVTVAVIDSGCDYNHEDLVNNYVEGYDASGSGIGDISENSHGTHVCGIVSAVANNAIGVAGVSYNAKFMPIQVFSWNEDKTDMGTDSYCLLKAYNYIIAHAQEHNIKVINMSLGGERNSVSPNDEVLRKIEEAYANGIVTVCAAGNNVGSTPPYNIYPGDYLIDKHGFNVIALDKNRNKPAYSNYNKDSQSTKDIAGPGGTTNTSSVTSGNGILSTSPSGYKELFGTSMATPIVSGAAALIFAANPSLSAGQVIDIVHSTATDVGSSGFDSKTGYGLVNAYEAVKCAKAVLGASADEIMVGQTARFEPTDSVSGSWAWSSDDESVAAVNDGVVTGVSSGHATIRASRGSFSISRDITVYDASISGSKTVRVGSTVALALAASPTGGIWRWSSSNTQVANVSDGLVTGISAGDATITASLDGNDSIKATFDMTVESQPQPTKTASSTASSSSSITRSSPADSSVPSSTSSAASTSSVPSPSTNSQSSSSASSASSTSSTSTTLSSLPSSASASSTHSSSASSTSSASSASSSSSSSTSSSSSSPTPDVSNATMDAIGPFTYTGRTIMPTPKVRINGAVLDSSHYTLSYENATRAGTATVTAKGIGDYRNLLVSRTYKIMKASQKISVKTSTAKVRQTTTASYSPVVRCISQVTGKKTSLVYKKKGGSGKLSISSTTGLATVKKGTKKGTYKAAVAVYAKASDNYKKSNTVTKTFTVKVQ